MKLIRLTQKAAMLICLFFIAFFLCTACATKNAEGVSEELPASIPSEQSNLPTSAQTKMEDIPERHETADISGKKLYVLFYPDVDASYVNAISEAIESEFKLTVVPSYIDHAEPDIDMRDTLDEYMQKLVKETYRTGDPTIIRQVLPMWGLTEADLKTKEGRQRFGLNMYLMSGYDLEIILKDFNSMKPQYSATALIDEARWAFELTGDYVGTLAVTTQDLYSGDSGNNYVFTKVSGSVGVMSTSRLTADGLGRSVFCDRITKQAISTVAGILRLSRCTTPDCVRSEAETVSEIDAKNAYLCNDCIDKLNEKYAAR